MVRFLSYTLTSRLLAETDVKMTSRRQKLCQNHHTDVMHESSYTPHVRQHFLAPVGSTEIPAGYARRTFVIPTRDKWPWRKSFRQRAKYLALHKASHTSLVTRKPVLGVSDQVRLSPACSATQTS